mmetsp:Transcript_25589/g.74017  ORF Transcript_25589/g.74017 Transcript_25589/m.74017 type:complete len:200 (+) Transcript_25589:368-967(+)
MDIDCRVSLALSFQLLLKFANTHGIHLKGHLTRRSDVALDYSCNANVPNSFIITITASNNPVRINLVVQHEPRRYAVMPRNAEGGIALPILIEVAYLVDNDDGHLELIGDALESLRDLEDGADPRHGRFGPKVSPGRSGDAVQYYETDGMLGRCRRGGGVRTIGAGQGLIISDQYLFLNGVDQIQQFLRRPWRVDGHIL